MSDERRAAAHRSSDPGPQPRRRLRRDEAGGRLLAGAGQLVDGVVVVVGSIDITFADHGVSVPSSPIVVSAEDTGTLELQLFLQQA